ncbi:MAG TPA: substrate-binding domain-containing protein [Pyrinomonadaceae bacterium]|nr:substrate-binding domain-containing protein [Pyrinomonadaceae bacterium]
MSSSRAGSASAWLRASLFVLLVLTLLSCSRSGEVSQTEQDSQPATAQQLQPEQSAQQVQQPEAERHALRVCADPNNLPFSNQKQEGFENKIAALVAREMNLPVEYTWWAQRRGFVRNTLKAGLCDVVIGVPSGYELALTTQPYYRSTYAFVYRKDRGLQVNSFDDPVLRNVRVGVQLIGDDFANTPPAHALTNRHIVENVKGYSIYGDYAQANPPSQIIEAVAKGDVDVAVAWGPLAGYFAKRQRVPLAVVPVSPQVDLPHLPFVFDISMGVRRGDGAMRDKLDEIINRDRAEIEKILDEYGVPRVGDSEGQPGT